MNRPSTSSRPSTGARGRVRRFHRDGRAPGPCPVWWPVHPSAARSHPMSVSYEQIAKMIDHSLLAPTLTVAELEAGVRLARTYGVASVCIVPNHLRRAADLLMGSG